MVINVQKQAGSKPDPLSFCRILSHIIARRRPGFGKRLCVDAGCHPKPETGPTSLQTPFRKPRNGLASLQGRFQDGFHIFASLQRRFRIGGTELVDGALPKLILQTDFLDAPTHGGEVLVVRRVRSSGSRAIAGRPRDGDDVNLNRDVHNDCVLLMILEVNCVFFFNYCTFLASASFVQFHF